MDSQKDLARRKLIGVGSDNTVGKNVNFWVQKFGRVDEVLKSELDEQVGRGNTSQNSAWWMYSPRHRNWDSEEALLALTEPGAIDYWKRHLIQIAGIVTSTFTG